ncbi:MAG: adenosine kinase [Cytophagales bacterium]|nr:adenosine kinase [Armatimonadota bacterium]
MTLKKYDVFGMCNALFDIQAEVKDETLTALSLSKGGMMLLSEAEQRAIVPEVYAHIVNTGAGGSGANTAMGVAQLGGTACFTSRVGPDEHGIGYRNGLAAEGVQPNLGVGDGDTGISLILITPDAQRTMCTYLGMARELRPEDVNLDDLAASRYLYVTGYLWDTETQKETVVQAMEAAVKAGVKVAFSLSDPFCVGRHKEDFLRIVRDYADVVFANAEEAVGLTDEATPRAALAALAAMLGTGGVAAVTQDKDGSLLQQDGQVYEIPIYPVKAIDTTGAGDMYAAGLLYGLTQNLPLPVSGRIAAYAAAQVVAHLGPRVPNLDLEAVAVIKSGL